MAAVQLELGARPAQSKQRLMARLQRLHFLASEAKLLSQSHFREWKEQTPTRPQWRRWPRADDPNPVSVADVARRGEAPIQPQIPIEETGGRCSNQGCRAYCPGDA